MTAPGELRYPGELAQALRGQRQSTFLLTAPPLRLPGAMASPVMPVTPVTPVTPVATI